MSAKTYDRQTAKFLAVVGENMPEISGDVMQGWIQNPRGLQKFLKGLCPPETVGEPKIITIDRTQPFDPVEFGCKGLSVAEEDERSLVLTQLDMGNVRLVTMLRGTESFVTVEERLERLKKVGYIRLDAKVFQTLLENPELIPESWKERFNENIRYIHFEGTVLRGRDGRGYVPCLYWHGGQWHELYDLLADDRYAVNASAVLTSI